MAMYGFPQLLAVELLLIDKLAIPINMATLIKLVVLTDAVNTIVALILNLDIVVIISSLDIVIAHLVYRILFLL